jgi:hypothetical protein
MEEWEQKNEQYEEDGVKISFSYWAPPTSDEKSEFSQMLEWASDATPDWEK